MGEMERFGLTEEEQMLQDMVRRLAKEKVAPAAEERDKKGDYPYDMLELMRENGLMGVDFPEAYAGMEAGMLAHCIVVEELAKADASVALIPSVQELGSLPIILAGNHEQKEKYLTHLSTGETTAAFGLTESKGGSDVAALKTRAVKKGDKYILNGSKMWITNGGVADTFSIYAVTDPDVAPYKGASVFIVEKGWPGFSIGKKESKLGIRSSDTRELVFEDVEVPVENLLGDEGMGFHIMMKTLDFSRPSVAAQALGIATGAFEYATQYAKERVAFGKPIIKHQAIAFKLADMAMKTTAARMLLWKTCSLLDKVSKDMSKIPPETIRHSSMSKAFCSDVAMWTTVEAVQVLGGFGYSTEYPVERMMRDAKITQIYEGTNEIQRLVIAGTL
ncbi:MAG: acyl-CoA dehydrogenase family protein [Deltaproteobacteria bacterium]|nr:acyl-CoA dehydrogenase family protein [Deltaproteobacteria bacterium]